MKLVVDTNILYTFFWKKSVVRRFLMKMELELFSPEYALEEINRHEPDILKKTELSKEEFNAMKYDLAIAIEFIPAKEYKDFFKSALEISPDGNDVDFFALALRLKLPLWSNDSLFKRQSKVKVFSTSDLLKESEFFEAILPDDE